MMRIKNGCFVSVFVALIFLFLSACGGSSVGGSSDAPATDPPATTPVDLPVADLVALGTVSGTVTEVLGEATFTVRLLKQPSQDVVIPLASSDDTEATVSPRSLTFNSIN